MLYRHIYRHEFSWGDIAENQPEPDQFACMMVFLGAAERLFSSTYATMMERQRDVQELQARRDQYLAALEQVTRELIAVQETTVALTESSLDAAASRLRTEIAELADRRASLLEELRRGAQDRVSAEEQTGQEAFSELGNRLAELRTKREEALKSAAESRERLAELNQHRVLVTEELGKLERARAAQVEMADLRITHCPNCDQRVKRSAQGGECVLCLQPYPERIGDERAGAQRIAFEIQQLATEAKELDELVAENERAREALHLSLRNLEDDIRAIEGKLRPARSAAAWILPPELGQIDQDHGRLNEQLRQLDRIRHALKHRDELAARVDRLQEQLPTLRAQVQLERSSVKFEQTSQVLADGMNSYLNALNAGGGPPRWQGGRVGVRLRERRITLTLNGHEWKPEAGGTYTFFFLAAYQYALLGLTATPGAAYPGFAVIDLPPNVSDNRLLVNHENYLAEPFIDLLNHPDLQGTQLLLTGHAYAGLEGAHRITLSTVFQPEEDESEDEEPQPDLFT
jgi:hypothetical protein